MIEFEQLPSHLVFDMEGTVISDPLDVVSWISSADKRTAIDFERTA